jgi:hypothetical protein
MGVRRGHVGSGKKHGDGSFRRIRGRDADGQDEAGETRYLPGHINHKFWTQNAFGVPLLV